MLHSLSTTSTTAAPQLAPAYLAGLHDLTVWSSSDRARAERGIADTQEHLLAGLRILDNLSRVTGETIGVHDTQIASMRAMLDDSEGLSGDRLTEQLRTTGFLEARRQRYVGTSGQLARMFDKICERMSGSHQQGGRC